MKISRSVVGAPHKVIDLVFRMEQLDPDFLSYLGRAGSSTAAGDPPGPRARSRGRRRGVRAAQDAAIETNQSPTETKKEPVRNTGRKVGRNDPRPCGSGKSSRRAI